MNRGQAYYLSAHPAAPYFNFPQKLSVACFARFCGWRLNGLALRMLFGGVVDHVLEFFAGLEEWDLLGRHFHAVSGLGLRPTRGLRWRVRKLPKPRISILSPARSERTTLSMMVSTMISLSFRVISISRETSSIKSALVILPAPCSDTKHGTTRFSRRRVLNRSPCTAETESPQLVVLFGPRRSLPSERIG